MPTKARIPASRSSKAKPPPSDGGRVCAWIERFLVHGAGDWFGKPFRLSDEQRRTIWRLYERNSDGSRRVRRAVIGRPKGYGKTELAAAIAIAELAGPTAPTSPDIPVAAASFEQADLLFGAARAMVGEGPLEPFLEAYDKEILRKDGPGRLYRVAAAAGTNDGGRHSHRVADEVHEWVGGKERVHVVLTNGLVKRKNSWGLDISTAGDDLEALIGQLYRKGKAIEAGERKDDRFYFDWLEHPDPECDLSTEEAVRAAVAIAYRAAGPHVDLEEIVARFYEIPEYEFRRYYLNQFTATAEAWLPAGAWRARQAAKTDPPPAGADVFLAFDGSYNRDSTALVGCLPGPEPYLFVVGCWERPSKRENWTVPRSEVDAAVDAAMKRWRVKELACDPPGWHQEIDQWAETYGPDVVVAYPTNKLELMADACSKFYTAVVTAGLSHDGDARLSRHLANARVKELRGGRAYITKDGRDSPRKIDLAVAAVVAHDRATQSEAPSVYERRGLIELSDEPVDEADEQADG